MLIKRKLFSVMDEEGNLGYYLYNESTGEEKLFSIVDEEERMYASVRHTKKAVTSVIDSMLKNAKAGKFGVDAGAARQLGKLSKKPSMIYMNSKAADKISKAVANRIPNVSKSDKAVIAKEIISNIKLR